MRYLLAIWALVHASVGFGQAAPVPRPSVEAFAALPFVENMQISPDGARYAGIFGINGERVFGILNVFDSSEKSTIVRIPDGTETDWIKWVNDDNVVLGLRTLLTVDIEKWYVTRAISINRKTGEMTKLLWDKNGQNASDLLWTATDGSPFVLMAAQGSIYLDEEFWPTVYRIDVTNGKRSTVKKGIPSVMDWSADASGRLRAGYGYLDEKRTSRLLYRPEAKDLFRTVDRANLKAEESLTTPFLFLPGDHGLAIHDDKDGRAGIFEVDLMTQEDVRTVWAPEGGGEAAYPILSSDRAKLLGVATTDQTDDVRWIDPAMAALQNQFDKAVSSGKARILTVNRDQTRMLVSITAPDTPGAVYFYDTRMGRLQRLAYVNKDIGSKRLAPVKLVQYKARDGLQIEAILTLPPGRDAKKLPFIVMPHGGPWAQDSLGYDYWAQFLASRGYAVLQPNFRGSTGYGTEFMKKGQGQLGQAMQDDVSDGVKWAAAQGIADSARVCIVGASYGGYAAMWGIVKDPDQYRCAISISGVSNLRREVNDFRTNIRGGLYADQWQKMAPDFAAVSPINNIARIKTPLLLIHGKKDVTVDHVQSAKMHTAMQKAGKSIEFVSLPLADHYFGRQADRVTLLSSMEAFLSKHNPAD